jgi:hypothetical protein
MAYDGGGIKALKPKPIGGRQRENMTLSGEKALDGDTRRIGKRAYFEFERYISTKINFLFSAA